MLVQPLSAQTSLLCTLSAVPCMTRSDTDWKRKAVIVRMNWFYWNRPLVIGSPAVVHEHRGPGEGFEMHTMDDGCK